MLQQKLERNIHTKDIELFFQVVEPSIEQIIEQEKGTLVQTIQSQLSHYLDITTEEHRERLNDKFPKSSAYGRGEIEQEYPPHQDHWEEAKVGDIVRKTGWYYASNVENGNYYVVLEVHPGHVTVFDVDGQIKTICYPEEYAVVGNIEDTLHEYHEAIRLESRKIKLLGWENRGLADYERKNVDRLLHEGKIEEIVERFTEKWKSYYDFGAEQEEKGLDFMSQLFGKKKKD